VKPAHNGKATAQSMATRQREISVSEFFSRNRHLLGFDNPRQALLTGVKEAVDNSLDACEEAGILPEIEVALEQLADDRYLMRVVDNGPGIVKGQIPNIFGKLLYGSKFHRLRMSRGQQGIGISAAGAGRPGYKL
jgi:DNA topoisomerase-6 subunit B